MKTVLQIIQDSGGFQPGQFISIENEPWMRLVIEVLPESGPDGHTVVISVAHYGQQNSDLMRDPEVTFEVVEKDGETELWPFYFRNDYVGIEQWSRYRDESGDLVCLPQRTRDMEAFAIMWDRNLAAQGFLEAFRRKLGVAPSVERNG